MSEEKLTRESLVGKTTQEIQKILNDASKKFQDSLKGLTRDELAEIEKELIEEFTENDEYIKNRSYSLPKEVTFQIDNETIPSSKIDDLIINFLNKIEVQYGLSLGIYQGIKFWKEHMSGAEVPYGVYDSTLRLLGQLKFRGESECRSILQVNDYLHEAHPGYLVDSNWVYFLAGKHQAILAAYKEIETEENRPIPEGSMKVVKNNTDTPTESNEG